MEQDKVALVFAVLAVTIWVWHELFGPPPPPFGRA